MSGLKLNVHFWGQWTEQKGGCRRKNRAEVMACALDLMVRNHRVMAIVQGWFPDGSILFGAPGHSSRVLKDSSTSCRQKIPSRPLPSSFRQLNLCQSLTWEGPDWHKGSYRWRKRSESCPRNLGVLSRLAGLSGRRNTLTCRSDRMVSPRPCDTPPAWFLSKILINRNSYFHIALAVWICKCLFNAPKTPSTLSEHMALYKGSWNADAASLAVTLLRAWQLCSPKPAKWVLCTEDMPQLPSTICLVGGCAASAQTDSCPWQWGKQQHFLRAFGNMKKKILQKEYVKLLHILDATAIMLPHS